MGVADTEVLDAENRRRKLTQKLRDPGSAAGEDATRQNLPELQAMRPDDEEGGGFGDWLKSKLPSWLGGPEEDPEAGPTEYAGSDQDVNEMMDPESYEEWKRKYAGGQ